MKLIRFSCSFQTNAYLRAAYEGKIDLVLELLEEGVPIDAHNQVRWQHIMEKKIYITGPLWGEYTSHQWILHTKDQ